MWHTLIQYPQGTNPNLKSALSIMHRLKRTEDARSKKHWHKPFHPRLLATGIQAGGSLILSTHLKNGMTADSTGEPVLWVVQYRFVGRVSTYRRIWNFFIVKIGYI